MAIKTYVLTEALAPDAPVYIRVAKDKRVKVNKIPLYQVHLKYTFQKVENEGTDKEIEKNVTIRLKLNSNSIYLDEQVKEGIPANEKFTTKEYAVRSFRNGSLTTGIKIVQDYLEATPEFVGFKGRSQEFNGLSYTLVDKENETKVNNQALKDSIAAANKIINMSLKEGQDTLIKIYGTHTTVPKTIEEVQNLLADFINTGEEAVAEILKGETTIDDDVKILIGRLVSGGKLSFDAVRDQVVKKNKTGDWIKVRDLSSEYSPQERERFFTEFLTSPAGATLLADLKADVSVLEPKIDKKEKEKIE